MTFSNGISVLALVALGLGCDPQAKAGSNGFPGGDDQLSRAGETCGTTLHCGTGLRCMDQICRPEKASTLGDFYLATGDLAMSRGDVPAAIDAYTRAVNQYEADKIATPPEVYCAQGAALTADRGDPAHGEQAARVLHRCLLSSSPGSEQRRDALRNLAQLEEVGLDPLLLARTSPADKYLTKSTNAPAVDNLEVTVVPEGRAPRSRSYTNWIEMLQSDRAKQAMLPCWQRHWKATHEPQMTGRLVFKHGYRLDDYDDFDRSTLEIGEVAATADGGTAAACMRTALVPIADEFAKSSAESSWRVTLAISIGE